MRLERPGSKIFSAGPGIPFPKQKKNQDMIIGIYTERTDRWCHDETPELCPGWFRTETVATHRNLETKVMGKAERIY